MLLRAIVEALQERQSRRRAKKNRRREQESSPKTTSTPLAYALARSWAWPALKYRCETHPHEVSQQSVDSRGETILHWTCIGKPPLDTVQAILTACPELARMRNKLGHLPLHVATSYRASVEVVRALLEVFPESAGMPNGVGAYPLHLLCDYGSSVDSLRAVLETQEGVATITTRIKERSSLSASGLKHTSPLNLLNARMDYLVFMRAIRAMQEARSRQDDIRQEIAERKRQCNFQGQATTTANSTENSITDTETEEEDPLQRELRELDRTIAKFQSNDYWRKASLLVLAEYTLQPLPIGRPEPANMVHACAGIPNCPSFLLEFAMLLCVDDLLTKKDAQGRLPLHVAALCHAKALCMDPTQKETRRYRDCSQRTLCAVLKACPQAAKAHDDRGHAPLTVALRKLQTANSSDGSRAWSSGLQALLDANVRALETLNLSERLYPHVWARRMSSADHLFQSIRQHPYLLQ